MNERAQTAKADGVEADLEEMLSDEVMTALLERDGVDPDQVRIMIAELGARRRALGLGAPPAPSAAGGSVAMLSRR